MVGVRGLWIILGRLRVVLNLKLILTLFQKFVMIELIASRQGINYKCFSGTDGGVWFEAQWVYRVIEA